MEFSTCWKITIIDKNIYHFLLILNRKSKDTLKLILNTCLHVHFIIYSPYCTYIGSSNFKYKQYTFTEKHVCTKEYGVKSEKNKN